MGRAVNFRKSILFCPIFLGEKIPEFPGFLGISKRCRFLRVFLVCTWKDSLPNGWFKWDSYTNTGCYLANLWKAPWDWTPLSLIMGFYLDVPSCIVLSDGMVHIPTVGCCCWWQNLFTGFFAVALCFISVPFNIWYADSDGKNSSHLPHCAILKIQSWWNNYIRLAIFQVWGVGFITKKRGSGNLRRLWNGAK